MIDKVNLEQTLDRWTSFLERTLGGGILASIRCASGPGGPTVWDPDTTIAAVSGQARARECLLDADPEGVIARARREVASVSPMLSDSIPAAYPSYNLGECVWSGFLGADLQFFGTEHATWSAPSARALKTLEGFDFSAIDMQNRWIQRSLAATRQFAERLYGRCDIAPLIFYDCLNLLCELRGPENALLDIVDTPDLVKRFLDWSLEQNHRFFDAQAELARDAVRAAFGGHPYERFSYCRVPFLSVDAYSLASDEVYEGYGLEHHQSILERYGGGRLHIHANGRKIIHSVSRLSGLSYCFFTDEPGFPQAAEVVEELRDALAPTPIGIPINAERFVQGLDERSLPEGVLYSLRMPNAEEANRLMERVFDYSARGRGCGRAVRKQAARGRTAEGRGHDPDTD